MNTAEKFHILSSNCQGRGQKGKRRDVFNYLKMKNCNVYCIQDTHFTKYIENDVTSMWGTYCLYNSYVSNSRGVAILFEENVDKKLHKEKRDNKGNYLAIDITLDDHRLTLINIYAPNDDNPSLIEEIADIVEDFGNIHNIICGDFNISDFTRREAG